MIICSDANISFRNIRAVTRYFLHPFWKLSTTLGEMFAPISPNVVTFSPVDYWRRLHFTLCLFGANCVS